MKKEINTLKNKIESLEEKNIKLENKLFLLLESNHEV